MAEVLTTAAVLGAGTLLANNLFKRSDPPQIEHSPEEEFADALDSPEKLLMDNARHTGILAPPFGSATTRVPWDMMNPPYYVYQPGVSHLERPMERTFEQYFNALHHNRKDFETAVARNRQQIARRRPQPIYTGFTPEMTAFDSVTGDKMQTQHMQWTWMPNNPTDSQYNDAALLAKALPADPLLFTPDANFMTAPGLPFRYA